LRPKFRPPTRSGRYEISLKVGVPCRDPARHRYWCPD
jgi:hypothetical protein